MRPGMKPVYLVAQLFLDHPCIDGGRFEVLMAKDQLTHPQVTARAQQVGAPSGRRGRPPSACLTREPIHLQQ
jgi:hypothetical protein